MNGGSSHNSGGKDDDLWIYHERQEALLCGQHALNNLVQAFVFTAESLGEIAQQLDEMELTYMSQNNEGGIASKDYIRRLAEGSGNVDPSGNFSIEVLRSALMSRYELELPNIRQEGVRDVEVTTMEGFICHRDSHWFAIRKIHDRFWNLNSTADRPQLISHFRLAAEIESLQNSGYSVFCVQQGLLPNNTTTHQDKSRGLPQYWWKQSDLLRNKSNATTAATDPWNNVGSGMRLDGKTTTTTNNDYLSMSEEEMMQMAIASSLQTTQEKEDATIVSNIPEKKQKMNNDDMDVVELKEEPSSDEDGVVKVQFRLPNGTRTVRRFYETELVGVFYTFVKDSCPSSSSSNPNQLELRCGFPPKDLLPFHNKTMKEAQMANESITCRYLS